MVYEMTTSQFISILPKNCLYYQSSPISASVAHIMLSGLDAGGQNSSPMEWRDSVHSSFCSAGTAPTGRMMAS